MPRDSARALQRPRFVQDTVGDLDAVSRDAATRPVRTGERALPPQRHVTGINDWRLWRDLPRVRRRGLLGLSDPRRLPHPRGKPTAAVFLPRHIQQQSGRRAMAHPCTARARARSVRDGDAAPVDHRGLQRVLAHHHRAPEAWRRQHQRAQPAPVPPWPPGHQPGLPCEPTAEAQRLEQALGPAHRLVRLRPDREDPTEELARWRSMELWAGGVRPRRIAARLAIAPPVVSTRPRRFKAQGLFGCSTRPRERPSLRTRVSVQVRRDVVHRRENTPRLGPYRAKMALDALGSRDGHTTVWPLVALSKQAHPTPAVPPRTSTPAARPLPTTAPHQVWVIDGRDLTTIAGHWLASLLRCDGDRRAIVGAGCCDRPQAQVVQDDQFRGHWAHKRTDARGRIYSLSPEGILGNARGRAVEPTRLRRVFRRRQRTRQVRPQGPIRRHNFGPSVAHGRSGQTVAVLSYDETLRIERAAHLLVASPCVYAPRQRRMTAVHGTGRPPYRQAQMLQLRFWALELARTVWRMPR